MKRVAGRTGQDMKQRIKWLGLVLLLGSQWNTYINYDILIRYRKLWYSQPFSPGGTGYHNFYCTLYSGILCWILKSVFQVYYFVILLLPLGRGVYYLLNLHPLNRSRNSNLRNVCIQCLMWKTKRKKKKTADLRFVWHTCYIDMSISGVKIIIWGVIPCNLLDMNQHHGGTCYLYLQVPWSIFY